MPLATGKLLFATELLDTLLSSPTSVVDYIKYMRGVDRGDQLISLYNSGKRTKKWWKRIFYHCLEGKRTKKWWKRIFYHCLEAAVLNAYILYDKLLHTKTPLLQFKKDLAVELVGGRSYRKGVGGRPRREDP